MALRLARGLRHARHLRAGQALAQARHMLGGGVRPLGWDAAPPQLAFDAPAAPFLPAPPHAHWDGAGGIELISRPARLGVDAAEIDWDFAEAGPLWAYQLHFFEWARPRETADRVGELALSRGDAMAGWGERCRGGTGWDPHPLSARTLAWTKLLLTQGAVKLAPDAEERVRASLAAQLRTLASNLEERLQGNHLLTNLLALVCGGLAWRGGEDRWLAHMPRLRVELAAQIGEDGAHEERSPMYHALLLENVLDALNLARAAGVETPDLAQAAARMLGALRVFTHPDGEIALFADSAFELAQPPARLEQYAAALGVSARHPAREGVLEDAGFVRLAAGPFTLIASVAGPAPAHQPGHAHCDALAFELSIDADRVVTDAGVFEYVPGARRALSRATRSHSTLEVGGSDQAEVWSGHRVGGRPRVALGAVEPGRSAVAECRGWATRATRHERRFAVSESGVEIRDRIDGRPQRAVLSLPLAPGLDARLDGARARVALPGGRALHIDLPEARWRVERRAYFPRFGCEEQRDCLVGKRDGTWEGSWRFRLEA